MIEDFFNTGQRNRPNREAVSSEGGHFSDCTVCLRLFVDEDVILPPGAQFDARWLLLSM